MLVFTPSVSPSILILIAFGLTPGPVGHPCRPQTLGGNLLVSGPLARYTPHMVHTHARTHTSEL